MADNKAAKTAETKTRKQRASKKLNYDQVLQHVFALTLKERAEISKASKESVSKELADIEASTKEAFTIINTL